MGNAAMFVFVASSLANVLEISGLVSLVCIRSK